MLSFNSLTNVPILPVLWNPYTSSYNSLTSIFSLLFLPNSPPLPSYRDHTIHDSNLPLQSSTLQPLVCSPTSSRPANTVCGKATCPHQCICPFGLLEKLSISYLGCWEKKKITKPYRLRPPKTHGLYHQLPGNLSVSPGSSYFLTTLSLFTDVLKVCAPSLLGYILFTLKI